MSDSDGSKITNPVASKQERKLVWLIRKNISVDCIPPSEKPISKVLSVKEVRSAEWEENRRFKSPFSNSLGDK